jgi:hypothetical protein
MTLRHFGGSSLLLLCLIALADELFEFYFRGSP